MGKPRRKGPKQPRVVCSAKRLDGTACDATVYNASSQDALEAKWCRKHHEEYVALDKEYQSYGMFFLEHREWTNVCKRWGLNTIAASTSGRELDDWYGDMDNLYCGMQKGYQRYLYLATHYFFDDPAFKDTELNKALTDQHAQLRQLMPLTAERARHYVLEEENGSWIIQPSASLVGATCNHSERANFPSSYPPRRDTQQDEVFFRDSDISETRDERDPVKRAHTQRVQELQAEISLAMASLCAPPHSDYFKERMEVIFTAVGRAMCQDSDLFLRARHYNFVSDFLLWLSAQNHDVDTMQRLLRIVENIDAHAARRAVEDMVLAEDPYSDAEPFRFIDVGFFNIRDQRDLPFSAWGHILAIAQCVPCVMETVNSVYELQTLYRFLDIYNIPNDWSIGNPDTIESALSGERQLNKALFCCGSIINAVEAQKPRHVIEEIVDEESGEPIWQEMQSAILLCGTISMSEPMAAEFVSICARQSGFRLLVREHGEMPMTVPSDAWWSRTRRAKHKRDLVHQPWEIQDPVPESFLERSNPLKDRPDLRGKSIDFVICDVTSCNLTQVKYKLAEIWLELYGVKTVGGLRKKIIQGYVEEGEVEEEFDDEDNKKPRTQEYVPFSHRPGTFLEAFILMMQLCHKPFPSETTDSAEMRFVNAAFRRFR
ncbi:hypothetical protein Moror_6183 [Moniliophthora roreri MCA 2997]|uniref:Uncharacterized protein n=1 Tax=Moniliophthora roreri (strain MCA 2997) TaxID=1381753 RepID=V2WCC5_MONRO|nr:hypothetical protein Moror_6183 [Moniliophthora roreri MCA 2997]